MLLDFIIRAGIMAPVILFAELIILIMFVDSVLKKRMRLKAILIWSSLSLTSGVFGTVIGQRATYYRLVEIFKSNPNYDLEGAVSELLAGFEVSLTTTILALIILLINIILFGIVNWIIEKRKARQQA